MKKLMIVCTVLCLLLCACGNAAPETTEATTTVPTTEAPTTAAPTTEAPTTEAPTTEAPTEPPVLYRHPLTGEPLEEPFTDRVFAVMLNNIQAAMPQHGNSEAKILYEFPADNCGVTRCVGLYTDVGSVEKLGAVRSARIYYVNLVQAYNAIYVHFGGSPEALDALAYIGWPELEGGMADSGFYRDQDRLYSGYAYEHTAFTTGENLVRYAEAKNYDLKKPEGQDFGLLFSDEVEIPGEDAPVVTANFGWIGKTTTFRYDEEAGNYTAEQFGEDYIDGNTGETLRFENVLVLRTYVEVQRDGVHLDVYLQGEGTGYYAHGGKVVKILWSREYADDPFVYTYEDGTPVVLGTGKTYIGVVPQGGGMDYE